MKNSKRQWLYAVLITAILVMNQAVFLLLSSLEVNAEIVSDNDINNSTIKFLDNLSGIIAATDKSPKVALQALANFNVNNVYFVITGSGRSEKKPAINQGNYLYSYNWDLNGWPYGTYSISIAADTELSYESDTTKVLYEKVVYDIPETTTQTVVDQFSMKFDQTLRTPVSGDVILPLVTNKAAGKVEIQITAVKNTSSIAKIVAKAIPATENKKFNTVWYTKNFSDGYYKVEAAAYSSIGELLGKTAYGTVEIINTIAEIENINSTTSNTGTGYTLKTSTTQQVSGASTSSSNTATDATKQVADIYTTLEQKGIPVVTDLCRQHGIENYYTCSIFSGLDKACQTQNIINQHECSGYLQTLKSCSDQNIPADKCQIALKLPNECRAAKVFTAEECRYYLYKAVLPDVCIKAGITSQEQCQQNILNSSLNNECVNNGLTTSDDCLAYLAKKQNQQECANAGMLTTDACKLFLFKKYGLKQDLDKNGRHLICVQANAQTEMVCNALLISAYFPQECQAINITDTEECKYFIEQVDLPVECTTAGISGQKECNEYMFSKFSPDVCSLAGINSSEECRQYIFNKFINEVDCGGQDPLICKSAIKNRYLGYVAAKQQQYKALAEYAQTKNGQSISSDDLISSDMTKIITPIKDGSAKLKIIASKSRLVLGSADRLTQTAPLALMLDADGDGLPDDIEKTIGADPNNQDSDGDGYFDGDEMRGGYNPLGKGKKEVKLSPIEEAVIREKTVEHPKTDGETSDKYYVSGVNSKPTGVGSGQKYNISGKAEPNSTLTVYLYSDLPLMAIVKTDAYGNWQYEIERPLQEGGHEIYIAVNDNSGKILEKSKPFQFFIKEAKALSPQDFIANERGVPKTKSMMNIYLIVSGSIIILGVMLFVGIYYFNKTKIQD